MLSSRHHRRTSTKIIKATSYPKSRCPDLCLSLDLDNIIDGEAIEGLIVTSSSQVENIQRFMRQHLTINVPVSSISYIFNRLRL